MNCERSAFHRGIYSLKLTTLTATSVSLCVTGLPFLNYSRLEPCMGTNIYKPNSITLAGSKLVAERFEAKFHYAIRFEAGR